MPVTTTVIEQYEVHVISEGDGNNFAATVWLYGSERRTIGFCRFYHPEIPMRENEFRDDLGYPLVSYPVTALSPMVDILRNEDPVYFTWYDYRPTRCFGAVGTSREAVGEMED